jgi:hypothetical protein
MRIYTPVLLGLLSILALFSCDLGRGYAARLDTDDKLTTARVCHTSRNREERPWWCDSSTLEMPTSSRSLT